MVCGGLGPIYSDSWFFTLITCHMIIDMMMELLDEHKGDVIPKSWKERKISFKNYCWIRKKVYIYYMFTLTFMSIFRLGSVEPRHENGSIIYKRGSTSVNFRLFLEYLRWKHLVDENICSWTLWYLNYLHRYVGK